MKLSGKIAGFPTWAWLTAGAVGLVIVVYIRYKKTGDDSGAVNAIPVPLGEPGTEQAPADWTPLGIALAALGAQFAYSGGTPYPSAQPAPSYASPNAAAPATGVAKPPTQPAPAPVSSPFAPIPTSAFKSPGTLPHTTPGEIPHSSSTSFASNTIYKAPDIPRVSAPSLPNPAFKLTTNTDPIRIGRYEI